MISFSSGTQDTKHVAHTVVAGAPNRKVRVRCNKNIWLLHAMRELHQCQRDTKILDEMIDATKVLMKSLILWRFTLMNALLFSPIRLWLVISPSSFFLKLHSSSLKGSSQPWIQFVICIIIITKTR
jgi:hypothetical protein